MKILWMKKLAQSHRQTTLNDKFSVGVVAIFTTACTTLCFTSLPEVAFKKFYWQKAVDSIKHNQLSYLK